MAQLDLWKGTCPGPQPHCAFWVKYGGVGGHRWWAASSQPALLTTDCSHNVWANPFSSLSLSNSNFTISSSGNLVSPGYKEHTGVSSQATDMQPLFCGWITITCCHVWASRETWKKTELSNSANKCSANLSLYWAAPLSVLPQTLQEMWNTTSRAKMSVWFHCGQLWFTPPTSLKKLQPQNVKLLEDHRVTG